MKLMLNSKTICDDTIEYLDNKYNANFEIVDSHFVFEPAQENLVNVIAKMMFIKGILRLYTDWIPLQ